MSAPQPRFLATYNSLTDKHLAGYFSNARIRQHLQRSGLISRSGRIIPEKEYRLNAMRRDHQRHVQECLARAIFHKVLDMERHHQLEIKRKLEYSAKKERVKKIKEEQFRRSVEDAIPMHSPHPPLGPRNHDGFHPLVTGDRAGRSQWRAPGLVVDYGGGHSSHQRRPKEPTHSEVSSCRPNTAPGNVQQPFRLQPLCSRAAKGSLPKASQQMCHVLEWNQQFARGGERSELRLLNSVEYVTGVSPYQLPVINPCVVPVPPPRRHRGDRGVPAGRSGVPTGRRFRPTTASNDTRQILTKQNSGGFPKSPLCTNAVVTMAYLGKSLPLSRDAYRHEIKVYQQHCGGENLCVYSGKLLEGETFQFISKRHHGFPFSLTFFLNGMQVHRLSCCCEYKHQRRSRLRSGNRYFRFLDVEGASPCYRCIIEMGLDKKLSPPKRKREYRVEKHVGSWEYALHSEPSNSSVEQKSVKNSMLVILPSHEASVETVEEKMETGEEYGEEEMTNQSGHESEDSQEDISKNGYDEDFEADEEVNEEGQTADQTNGMSESSSDDKNHNLDHGRESGTSSQKALQASDSEKDESDGYSDRDSENNQQEKRPADSLSSISTQCSIEGDSHAETMTDDGKEECDIKRASDSTAHAQYGNGNGENKLLRREENQETSALENKGINEAGKAKPEDLAAREDTGIFHENIMAMQHQSPEVNGELKQAGSGESSMNDEDKRLPVPWETRMLNVEDGNEESPQREEGGVFEDCKSDEEEMAKATGNDHPVNSDPEPGDSHAGEEAENAASTERDASEAPDGSFSAEGRRSLDVQEAAGQEVREGHVAGQRQALEQDGAAVGGDIGSKEAGGERIRERDLLPQEETGSALEESTPEEGTMAEEHPKGKGTQERVESSTEVSPGEQEVLVEGTESKAELGELAPGGEGPAGALLGRETDRALSEGQEGAGGVTEGEAVEKGPEGVAGPLAEEEVGEAVPEAGESLREGGSTGKGAVVGVVVDGEEAVEDANLAGEGIARIVDPEGEEAVEEGSSEGQEAVEKLGALLEALGDMETGEAMPGGEGFVKPNNFSQLKALGEERMEMGKAATGAAASERGQVWRVGGNALQRVEDMMEVPVEPGKGTVLEVAPGLGPLGSAGDDPISEGSSQVEETPAVQEEEGAVETLWSGNPSVGSKAETERAMEGKLNGGVAGGSAEVATQGLGGGEEATGGAAGPRELATGMEGWLRYGKERGKGTPSGEGVVGEAAVPAPGLDMSRAGEPGLVAIAVVGGQAGQGALAEELAGEPALAEGAAVAGDGRVGRGTVAQEGVTGGVLGAQSGTGVAVAEGMSAKGRWAARESGRDMVGVADGAVAGEQGMNQEAALGCEASGPELARAKGQGEAEWEWVSMRIVSPGHEEAHRAMSPGEQLTAETSPSTPAHGDGGMELMGRESAGGEGLCLGTQPQLAAPGTGALEGKDGQQEEMEQAGGKTEREQQGPHENTRENEVVVVLASAGSSAGAGQQRKDSPVGGSPGAADVGERSHKPYQCKPRPSHRIHRTVP
ncbi:glutamate-rich protein 3 isoform X3 [Neopelma chrysocephalum]|uniref:glutamate-rich protein 3 isoform X3 n=1 Tax=Neopelma chrysocephalum TaxID=114329 RepID=UPI000FCD0553|nr:glutamate-rich protein 3 isoform X3 [Neopelma chrysocephalum]